MFKHFQRVRHFSRSRLLCKPPIDSNGLYYGKFTKEEYDQAAKYVKDQYDNLANLIKGTTHIRENLDKMPAFPSIDRTKGGIKVENLSQFFEQTIKTTGPITLLAYMRQCLTHPDFGYYTTRNPLDFKTGDFITSPEISSMFGEMLGIWLYSTWLNQDKPSSINIIEFGPGKGTLMHDVIQIFNKFVMNKVKINIIMIESSSVLRYEQYKLLCNQHPFNSTEHGFNKSITKWNNEIWWCNTEKDIDLINESIEVPNYILAHEFFDALPIKSFIKQKNGWRELLVEHSPSVNNTQGKLPSNEETSNNDLLNADFHLTLAPNETPSSMIPKLNPRYENLPVDSRVEICPDSEFYLMKMIQLLNNNKGAVLIIDYGLSNQIPENSLRGIYKHKFVSPFIKPGEVDLSIDVDFQNLKNIAKNYTNVYGPVDQGDYLHECGIGHRAQQLLDKNSDNYSEQEKIFNSYKRLTDKDDKSMGKIYKFLCLLPKDSKPPVGFGGSV